MSIYFSEILDRVKAEVIFNIFGSFDKVRKVVIPHKRNKFGKHSGFARFIEMKDIRLLAIKLDNIFIDNVKIHANIPRFNKVENVFKGGFQGVGDSSRNQNLNGLKRRWNGFSEAKVRYKSFTEVVNNVNQSSVPCIRKVPFHLKFQYVESNFERFRMTFVGVVINPDDEEDKWYLDKMLVDSENKGDCSSSPIRDVNDDRLVLDNGSMDASRRDNHHEVSSMTGSMNRVSKFDVAIIAAKAVSAGTLVSEGGVDRDGLEVIRVENLRPIDSTFKGRIIRKYIGMVETENGMVDSVEDVKEVVRSFFKDKFAEPESKKPLLKGCSFKTLYVAEAEYLKALFYEGGIKAVVRSCDGAKSSGPDRFNFVFIKKFRLERVIGGLISHRQSEFVPGRQLLDGVLIANEIVEKSNRDKKEHVHFKVNFKKA
ncbi:hypothetical protein KIW84_041886 [Lathyrus oleraceus]|uniref:RRM domain-containing protein n=1 Tax=Pisum sativum TaxID=3888 RepID=A0A9D5ASN4_PEA|nr:hypothetical protein KIW84_041886 [Pisum sativum]